jgi:hypothetical protein
VPSTLAPSGASIVNLPRSAHFLSGGHTQKLYYTNALFLSHISGRQVQIPGHIPLILLKKPANKSCGRDGRTK